MDMRSLGLLVAGVGVVIVVLGLLIASGGLSWFGKLPGDIHWKGENTTVFIPITSMIVISVVLTVVLSVISRLR